MGCFGRWWCGQWRPRRQSFTGFAVATPEEALDSRGGSSTRCNLVSVSAIVASAYADEFLCAAMWSCDGIMMTSEDPTHGCV
ncbi:hypothetical protein RIF29_21032 [Crotalaria pallida]|uniref:Uncharacterized protein n=1 Tax=Crotalaria pallida TaxID=3830 RepID=A0AAN9F2B3_CROPI